MRKWLTKDRFNHMDAVGYIFFGMLSGHGYYIAAYCILFVFVLLGAILTPPSFSE